MISRTICDDALLEAYSEVTFDGPGYGDYYGSFCLSELKLASFFSADKVYCPTSTLNQAVTYAENFCHDNNFDTVDTLIEKVASKVTQEYVAYLPTYGREHFTLVENATKPFLISEPWFSLAYRTVDDFAHQKWRDRTNSWGLYGFWAVLLFLGTVRNILVSWQESRRSPDNTDIESSGRQNPRRTGQPSRLQLVVNFFVRRLCMPKLFKNRYQSLLGYSTPTRLEGLVLFMFWSLSLILCSVDYRAFSGNVYWSLTSQQTLRYIADRTGVMSLANLPILWLFSGRNNVLIWVTGWPFETFNLFHRHIARAATLQAIIHGAVFTAFYLKEEGGFTLYVTDFKTPWFYMGVVSVLSMSFLVGASMPWFRKHRYETFLAIHIALSVVLIVGLSYHFTIFPTEFRPYIWPLVAVWSFERAARIFRMAYCNIHIRLRGRRQIRCTDSTVHYDTKADILLIQMRVSGSLLKPSPGQHFFLYQPFRWRGWENHPFTLAHWETATTTDVLDAAPPQQSRPQIAEPEILTTSRNGSVSNLATGTWDRTRVNESTMTYEFWVRPQDGWTRRLRSECLSRPDQSCSPLILLEGPYGKRKPLRKYNRVLFIAGGSGIAVMVPYILERARDTPESGMRYSELIWVNKDPDYMSSVMHGKLSEALGTENVSALLFATAPKVDNQSTLQEGGGQDESEQDAVAKDTIIEKRSVIDVERGSHRMAIEVGRPDIRAQVQRAAREAQESQCTFAVVASGPASLTEAAREAVTMVMGTFPCGYFEESFGW